MPILAELARVIFALLLRIDRRQADFVSGLNAYVPDRDRFSRNLA
jgi:hypothetical protein